MNKVCPECQASRTTSYGCLTCDFIQWLVVQRHWTAGEISHVLGMDLKMVREIVRGLRESDAETTGGSSRAVL
jgi:hypothetical protein